MCSHSWAQDLASGPRLRLKMVCYGGGHATRTNLRLAPRRPVAEFSIGHQRERGLDAVPRHAPRRRNSCQPWRYCEFLYIFLPTEARTARPVSRRTEASTMRSGLPARAAVATGADTSQCSRVIPANRPRVSSSETRPFRSLAPYHGADFGLGHEMIIRCESSKNRSWERPGRYYLGQLSGRRDFDVVVANLRPR